MRSKTLRCDSSTKSSYAVVGKFLPEVPVELVFLGNAVSILRELTIDSVNHLKFVSKPPDSIETLVMTNVPINDDTAYIYHHIHTLFPNLRSLTINDGHLKSIGKLPDTLINLNLSRNKLSKLPKLPDSLLRLLTCRNRITKLPKVYPPKLKLLNIGCNLIEEHHVIHQNISAVQCDHTDKIHITGHVDKLTIVKCNSRTMHVNNPVKSLHLLPQRLANIKPPTYAKGIYLLGGSSGHYTFDLQDLHNLNKITGRSEHTYNLAKSTKLIIDDSKVK